MGKWFNRSDKKRTSIFDSSDNNYSAADSYGFIKEEQLPQNKSIRRRKILTMILTIVFSAVLFGAIASVVFNITSNVMDSIDRDKRTVDLRPSDDQPTPTPGGSEIKIDPEAFSSFEKMYEGVRITAQAYNSCIASVSAVTYVSDPVFGKQTAEARSFYGMVLADNGTEFLLLVRNSELDGDYESLLVSFSNGCEGAARVVKRNAEINLAVIAVPQKGMADVDRNGITPAELGDSATCDMGSAVIAVGCVNGRNRSVDFGFVNGESDTVYIRDHSLNLMQTNMARRDGAFGLLLNASGKVVGIISEDFDDGSSLRAIAINSLSYILNDMINNNKTPVFGAVMVELSSAARKKMNIKGGIQISEIVDGSPADEAGFRKGDIILKIQEEVVYYAYQFNKLLRREATTGTMKVTFLRGGSENTVMVKIPME